MSLSSSYHARVHSLRGRGAWVWFGGSGDGVKLLATEDIMDTGVTDPVTRATW